MRIIVCGGRDYQDWPKVLKTLDQLHSETPISLVIHGAARGADSLGDKWANLRGIPIKRFPAKWDSYGKRAGMLRNKEMAQHGADLCVAFPGGYGTLNMINTAGYHGIPVFQP